MSTNIVLSQHRISDFLDCRRRFQLRYVDRLPWPIAPLEEQIDEKLALGQRFHQVIHRHFLGFPVMEEIEAGSTLSFWWQTFKHQGPSLPPGNLFPELSVTVPFGRQLLTGRFDLLVIGQEGIHIYDWKTDVRSRSKTELQDDLQTRIYLALAAEGGLILTSQHKVQSEKINLTYWYVNQPEAVVTIRYDEEDHRANWTYLLNLVDDIDRQLAIAEAWPLSDNLDHCRRCAYQVYCRRIMDVVDLVEWEPGGKQPELERSIP